MRIDSPFNDISLQIVFARRLQYDSMTQSTKTSFPMRWNNYTDPFMLNCSRWTNQYMYLFFSVYKLEEEEVTYCPLYQHHHSYSMMLDEIFQPSDQVDTATLTSSNE